MENESKKMINLTKLAKNHLMEDESIKHKILGMLDGNVKEKKVAINGIFLATNMRLFFCNKKESVSFEYNKISAVELVEKKLTSPTISFLYNGDKTGIKFAEQGDIDGFVQFLEIPKIDKMIDFSQLETEQKNEKKTSTTKQIKETKCTCSACGKVWYYGKEESIKNYGEKLESFGASMSNAGKDMMCCTGCLPALFMPQKQEKEVKDLDKCPDCGSKAVNKELVVHNVE
ncbi:PH domain-containing protein [Oceanobacillus sp. FSL K6-0251]|uniref:PH domain-containing protein n=1 Tax=Oceanobacillus sp. FSL K6-0251 TaxID=2921602 RepID=UPI0030F7150D